jgi:hypothetical protein
MTKPHDRDAQQREHRGRLAEAAITGLLAGLTRAIVDALLHHLTTAR